MTSSAELKATLNVQLAALGVLSELAREYSEEWYQDKKGMPWPILCANDLLDLYEEYIQMLHNLNWLPDIKVMAQTVVAVVAKHRDAWHVLDSESRFSELIEE